MDGDEKRHMVGGAIHGSAANVIQRGPQRLSLNPEDETSGSRAAPDRCALTKPSLLSRGTRHGMELAEHEVIQAVCGNGAGQASPHPCVDSPPRPPFLPRKPVNSEVTDPSSLAHNPVFAKMATHPNHRSGDTPRTAFSQPIRSRMPEVIRASNQRT